MDFNNSIKIDLIETDKLTTISRSDIIQDIDLIPSQLPINFSEEENFSTNFVDELPLDMNLGEFSSVKIQGEGGTSDHRLLQYRNVPNQHPIEAITSLTEELNVRPNTVITDVEIELL